MGGQSELVNDLKERGLRVTPQRAIILEAIEGLSGHITAEDIFGVVKEVNSYISLATVYRTLELLKELGLIIESNMGTSTTHYALRAHGTHHHSVCRVCGKTMDLPNCMFEPMIEQLRTDFNFVADAHHMVIMGWCEQCYPAIGEEQEMLASERQ
ncbi:MAG: transcriptional repressor [Anaerolineae bacterium]|nr:transcriptional repressor [Anaerolineae bacterium]MCB0223231.1 transcriptional repressor [Anaerolineae bacterium]MCB9108365.1 transcriptional repressor [Anaerolineales bacterium]